MKNALIAILASLVLTVTSWAQTTPQITSWQTANSGKYARQYSSTQNRSDGISTTTWTGHTSPSYSDVYEVWYDTTYVYVKYTGLPSYVIGPWLAPGGGAGTIMALPQNVIRRFPRTPSVPATTAKSSTSAGTSGLLVNGVHVFNNLDGQAWNGTSIATQAQHTTATYYWHRVASVAEAYNFDYGLGHSNPPGAYHNHLNPLALRYQLGDHVDYNTSTKVYSETAGTATTHSPILGWSHDGYPIYGPWGYSTATNASSGIRRMVSGYVKRDGTTTGSDSVITNNSNMPAWYLRYRTNKALGGTTNPVSVARPTDTTTYPIGTFAQDHAYLGDLIKTGTTPYAQGTDFDLDEYNGRFCYTPEYPTGTYAYFITIDASGNAVFPYILNFEHYGTAAAVPQQTVTTITGATNYVTAGPASAITFPSTPAVTSGTVSLTWNSVEGSTYSVEASTNQTSWTTKTASLAATSNSSTTSNSFTTIGSSGTEYARVTRTALATNDVPSVAAAVTTAQTGTTSYTAGAANNPPTLANISTLTQATEDTAFPISYTTLAGAADEADADGNAISFRVEAVTSGTLTKSGVAVTAGTTLLSTGESLSWTPAANVNGSAVAAFTVKAYDGIAASSTAITVNVNVTAVNDEPTLTTITALTGATAASAFSISYTTLSGAADEADIDGTTPSFRIEAVSSGTLTKGGTAITAGSTLLSSGESVTWTSAAGASGTVAAFTVKAYDGTLASTTAVTVNVTLSGGATVSPRLSTWYTAQAGKYARIVETDAELTANTTKTTWTRTSGPNTIAQTNPAYAGTTQIDYSTDWIYVRSSGLATYTMGPWYNNTARTQLFVNICKNQGFTFRLPMTTPTIPTSKTQINGRNVGGTLQPGAGFLVDGVVIYDPTDGFSYNGGTEASPGTGQWHRDAYVNEGTTFDKSMAHQQNTGMYHNHANPIALRYQLGDAVAFNNTTKAYSETLTPTQHSPIIGWMFDGLPLYGPYGYSTATDANSGVRRMKGGFVKRDGTTTGVDNITTAGRTLPAWMLRNNNNTAAAGPAVSTTYPLGRYIQDWAYLGDLTKAAGGNYAQGTDFDLNEYNVRWCVTPEFPSGTWAYFLNIDATGTPQFPYMTNRWFYGTPTGSTVTTITETVTNYFSGGPNRPLTITNATVTSPNVALTWNAVEGGTYSVDASSNNSTWTSKATGLTVSAANTKSNTHATLGSSGTEYARVNRTALATYDTTGTVAATVSQTASTSFNLGTTNTAPTLTNIAALPNGTEDTPYNITYALIAAAADEGDANGDPLSFRVEETFSGTLTKNGSTVTVGTLISSGDTIVWTPPFNGNGSHTAMRVSAWDGALASTGIHDVYATISPVNDAPTLTDVDNLGGAQEDSAFTITYAALANVSNEQDVDGDPISFKVVALGSGTLTKSGSAVAVGTLLSIGESFGWTPSANFNGDTVPFTFTAYDGAIDSSPAVNCTVNVAAVNDAPTMTSNTLGFGILTTGTLTDTGGFLAIFTNEADVDGDTLSFRIESVPNGSVTVNGGAVTPGVTTIASGDTFVWTPPSGQSGTITAMTLKAYDGSLVSSGVLTVNVNVTRPTQSLSGWAGTFGLSGADNDEDADPDFDGVPNGIEYILGRNPTISDVSTNPLTSTVSGGYLTLSFYRYDDSENNMILDLQYSSDLSTWTTVEIGGASSTSGGVIITVTENGTGMDLITVQMPAGTNTRMFSRITAQVD